MKETRIEVWFANGLFRAFPKVKINTFKVENGWIKFDFGDSETHNAAINVDQINFMEEIPED